MPLTVRQASRFLIGAAELCADSSAMADKPLVLSQLIPSILNEPKNEEGATLKAKLLIGIERRADRADKEKYLRNSPSHAQKTDKVLQSRLTEQAAFSHLYLAAQEAAVTDSFDAASRDRLNGVITNALASIDAMPGRAEFKSSLVDLMVSEMTAVSPLDEADIRYAVETAERAYIDAQRIAVMREFFGNDHANDEENTIDEPEGP